MFRTLPALPGFLNSRVLKLSTFSDYCPMQQHSWVPFWLSPQPIWWTDPINHHRWICKLTRRFNGESGSNQCIQLDNTTGYENPLNHYSCNFGQGGRVRKSTEWFDLVNYCDLQKTRRFYCVKKKSKGQPVLNDKVEKVPALLVCLTVRFVKARTEAARFCVKI